jgi:hypothetical protein
MAPTMTATAASDKPQLVAGKASGGERKGSKQVLHRFQAPLIGLSVVFLCLVPWCLGALEPNSPILQFSNSPIL